MSTHLTGHTAISNVALVVSIQIQNSCVESSLSSSHREAHLGFNFQHYGTIQQSDYAQRESHTCEALNNSYRRHNSYFSATWAKSHPHHVPQVLQLQANSPSCGSSCEPTGRHSMSCCCVRSDTGTQQLYNSVRRDCGRLALATKLVVQQHPSC